MPAATVIVATPANTKFLNLWNGTSNDTPPTGWWEAGFDDSAWETPVAVTPDSGDTGIGLAATYGLQPMWGASDSAGVPAIILTRTHFTAPATVTDGYGIPLTSTDIFNQGFATPPSGGVETSGEIFDGSGTFFGTHGLNVLNYYNGATGSPLFQPPNGPCFFQRAVSNLHLGADNVFASAINLGITTCAVTTPYGPFNPATRSSFKSWFAWGFRFFDEACSEYGYSTEAITADMVKVLRFSGSPPANWQTVAFDDSAWANAVPSIMGSLRADLGIFDLWAGWRNSAGTTGPGRGHVDGADVFYDPIATFAAPQYVAPTALWATDDESTAGESVIMRIRYTAPTLDSIIREPLLEAGPNTVYQGTLLARDFAGCSSITSYVNGFGGGSGIEIANFGQLIVMGQENLIALLMTTNSTSLALGYSAWVQLAVQFANCGPYTPPSTVTPTSTSARSYGQVIG